MMEYHFCSVRKAGTRRRKQQLTPAPMSAHACAPLSFSATVVEFTRS